MQSFLGRCVREVTLSVLFYAVFCLAAMSLVAVFVRAYAPQDGAVTAAAWVIRCAGSFLFPLLFVRRERALFKGAAAGAVGAVVTMLLFAAVAGAFSCTWLFAVELFACALLGGLGALAGVKLRKE